MINIIKKDGTLEEFNEQKIINAIKKSANRVMYEFSEKEFQLICDDIIKKISDYNLSMIPIQVMHNLVESALENINRFTSTFQKKLHLFKSKIVKKAFGIF